MKAALGWIQELLVRGVFLLVPVMVFGLLVAKALGMLRGVVQPIAARFDSVGGIPAPTLLAVVVLVLLCLGAGLVSKTRGARWLVRWLETAVLTRIPGYSYMKGMGESVAGVEGGATYQPVLARIEDAWQLGFIVETIEDGQFAVYVPGAPNPWSGSVYFMAEDRLRRVDMRIGDVQGCLKRLGIGSSALLKGRL